MRLIALVCVFAGCTFPQTVPDALRDEYVPTGEVQVRGRGATYDEVRVRSPLMNIAKRTDGSWGGTFDGRGIDVSVNETSVRGVDFLLSRVDSKPGHTVITGQFQGRIFRFEVDEHRALIRTPTVSMTFEGRQADGQITAYGVRGELELRGTAGDETPPWPQFAFVMLAAFN